MKRYIKTYFTCGLLLVGLLSACKEEDMTLGEGSVRLNVKVSDEVAVVSRAIDPGIYASMQTRIYSSKGLIRYGKPHARYTELGKRTVSCLCNSRRFCPGGIRYPLLYRIGRLRRPKRRNYLGRSEMYYCKYVGDGCVLARVSKRCNRL